MTYVIAEPCIDEKGKCPVEAIFPEPELPEQWLPFAKLNAELAGARA